MTSITDFLQSIKDSNISADEVIVW